jgi:Tetratrico peptide repeat
MRERCSSGPALAIPLESSPKQKSTIGLRWRPASWTAIAVPVHPIQLASTLRILGHLEESEQLLVNELDRHLQTGQERALHDEARATLALTYVAQGRAVEAAGLALCALAPYLSRYNRSVAANAAVLVQKAWN